MTLRLNGSTSGYTEIGAPAVAGNNTLVLPSGNGSADQVIATNGSGTLSFVDRGRMVLATAQNTTSGTAIDFTGIPSWVKRVTVMFNGVSTNGASNWLVRLGSASFSSTGYLGTGNIVVSGGATSGSNYTNGFGVNSGNVANILHGCIRVFNISGNSWVAEGSLANSASISTFFVGGSVTLSGTLDRLRLTTVNGTDTFDAGSINILYEG
jgi:hypothetical protein